MDEIKPTIQKWYYTLRNLAIVGMLSVLVYVAIRIIISSVGSEKAKYKKLLVDWLVAMCLLFSLHFIMAAINAFVEVLINMLASEYQSGLDPILVGIRTSATMPAYNTTSQFAFALMYIVLVCFTLIFTVFYLKRFLTITFLTLIAPMVAFTYPLDKISDGQAQAFNKWLKEYIFNMLIQPVHLLIYTVLITSALEFAQSNWIYSIIAIGFMTQAEQLIRQFFGFDTKAPKMGALGGLASVGLAANGIKSIASGVLGGGKQPVKSKNAPESSASNNQPIRQRNAPEGLSGFENAGNNDNGTNVDETPEDSELNRSDNPSPDTNLPDPDNGEGFAPQNPDYGTDWQRENRYKELEEEGITGQVADRIVQNELGDEDTSRSPIGEDGTDYERAVKYRDFKDQGLSHEEAMQKLDAEVPENRYQTNGNPASNSSQNTGNGGATNTNPQSNSNPTTKNKRKGKIKKAWRTLTKPRLPRVSSGVKRFTGKALSTGAKVVGAATGATMGAAVGIATGKNVIQNMAAGAGVGIGVANVGARVASTATDGISSLAHKGLNKSRNYKLSKQYNSFVEQNKERFKQEYGSRDYKKKLEEARDYVDAGYTNFDDIKKGLKIQERNGFNQEQAMNVMELDKKVGSSILDKNKSKAVRDTINTTAGSTEGKRIISALEDIQTGMIGREPISGFRQASNRGTGRSRRGQTN